MRAAIYTRISLDRESEEKGVKRQHEDCQELAARHGHEIIETYTDNDTGASTRSRSKRRPAYERMLDDARNGRFSVIIAYSNSRLTRRPTEYEELITLHEKHGVRIITCVSGADDLSTADGRMVARIKASVDAAEVERTAERVARAHLETAKSGKPVGGYRPFGWQDDRATLDPDEAALGRDALERLADGEGLRTICEEWAQLGILTRAGKPWTRKTLRQWALNPRLVGYRTYRREVLRDADGQPVIGQWQPMIGLDLYERVQARLRRPETRTRVPRKGARRYLLSGLLTCATCGGAFYAQGRTYTYADGTQQWRHYYRCDKPGCSNAVAGAGMDDLASELAVRLLEQAGPIEQEGEPYPRTGEADEARRKAAEVMAAFNAGDLPGELAFPAAREHSELAEQLDRERVLWEEAHRPVSNEAAATIREDWQEASTETRRRALEALVETFVIRKADKKGGRFDPERVTLLPRR